MCLPFLSALVAMAQPNCQVGIWSSPSPANALTINFEAYPLFDSTCFSPNSTYTWNFGDNGTGTGRNPVHTYNQPGVFGVCVTATTTFGFTVTQCDTVTVGPVMNCTLNFTYTQNANSITLVPITGGPTECYNINTVYTYSWGDGTSTTTGLTSPQSHSYSTNGTYTVCLNAFTPGVAPIQGTCVAVTINNNPSVGIFGQVLAGGNCLNLPTIVRLIAVNGPEEYTQTIGTGPDSCYYYFTIPLAPQRAWVVRAEPQNMDDFLPTYLGDVLYYTDATIFSTPNSPIGQTNPPINLIPNLYDSLPWDSLPPGLGTITGTILGAGTTVTSMLNGYSVTTTFQPQNAHVIVLNSAGQPIAIGTVNANGTFSIPNIPQGQYQLRIECPKVPSQTVSFEVTVANLNRNFTFTTNGTGINSTTSNQRNVEGEMVLVAPNPASSAISFYGVVGQISILDAQGRPVLVTSTHKNISIEQLPAGLYTLKGQSPTGKILSTRFIKN